ncbi:nucleoside hydrolase [Pseudonocardia endophytica]|uniref:Pyrimidine-specific ribonucleoside hydrolase n=1 Tax=Pseudonocardia endophytica TaxID=401976 RepID=A0A4R1HF88_PSEEN|nr:nucleoside hydrolase [Pseudonocardia endophytica]TCK20797.1 pyrimidine-specific ribonucleoside hydrolase [Pseudonocardia endophytica]
MPIPLIIDTDPGVDDAVALVLALRSPEVDVRAVVAAFGNVGLDRTLDNARRLVALAGRPDVPVAAGAARPVVHDRPVRAAEVHGDDGLGGLAHTLPDRVPLDPRPGIDVMTDVLRAATEPVTIASIGPLTDTALLLATHPELVDRIGRIVVMGGAIGAGNVTGAAEFNVYADPEAAHRVLAQAEVPVTLVPLDLTLRCAVGEERLARLAAGDAVCHRLDALIEPYRGWYRRTHGMDGVPLHDAVALLEAIVPGTLRPTSLSLQVACDLGPARGATVPDHGRTGAPVSPPVDVALDADVPALLDAVLTRLGAPTG